MNAIKTNYLIISVLLFSFFTGCSEKHATKYSDKNPVYAQLTKYTKIAKIIENDEVKAVINITYLNGSDGVRWDDGNQYFLVGIYKIKENTSKLSLTLQKEEERIAPLEIVSIENYPLIAQNIPLKNEWASYSIYKFKDIKDVSGFVLDIRDEKDRSTTANFEKNKY